MTLSLAPALAASLATACQTAAQGPPLVQPGAPGAPSRVITAHEASGSSKIVATAADIQFMQGMIRHHRQALQMTALLPSRTSREDMRLLGRRIELSQADEIHLMQRWLEVRGAPAEDGHSHEGHPALMPGMLTTEEMDRLAAASGGEFDRLFLELMIRHHDGALVMVEGLFSTDGAGQEAEVFAFATDVDTDQRIEIDRMRGLLQELSR